MRYAHTLTYFHFRLAVNIELIEERQIYCYNGRTIFNICIDISFTSNLSIWYIGWYATELKIVGNRLI